MTSMETIVALEATQEQHKVRLREMYESNYHIFRKEELCSALREYLVYLERGITGDNQSAYKDKTFSVKELERIIPELEELYNEINKCKNATIGKLMQ